MKIEEKRVGSSLLVRILELNIGADRAVAFKETIGKLIERGERRIVLDLSSVEFIDSSGLGAILSVLKRLGKDGELVVCGITPPVASMFKLTRMDRVFPVHETVEEALAAFCQ
ncbi:MAG: STAS domain-containing protein [Terriglobales bacterium]|jgi:anti-sigma B factor antagonist